MYFFYNTIISVAAILLRVIALFSPKISLFVKGRKDVFSALRKNISALDKTIWIHVASLGEFEQGLPVIEKLKSIYPKYKILITFFSPSGYEVKKNTTAGDIVTYLPLDTKKNVLQFLNTVQPELAIFVKYEVWPNYLRELQKRKIPTILLSAIFKKEHIYFKTYGGFMRKTLSKFTHIFVQNDTSKELLDTINYENVSISGDTRFDRVAEILRRDNSLDFISNFKGASKCFITGSSWPEDEAIITPYINQCSRNVKYIIAPHNIKADHILALKTSINKAVICYSEIQNKNIADYDVLIIDTIGLLTKIYSYAEITYVGGGFSTGLHNTLEPAVFGVPVIIGPNFSGFKEAEDLVKLKGVLPVSSTSEFEKLMNKFLEDSDFLKTTSTINKNYVQNNTGASIQILDYIRTLL
ncbi:glycosyltransferase N-terminal domain-containing protein [uncultured Maribacter sp.]|uniref:3-deoxy-D-manno-octulosonic acid transferase n=1 Tax=uncultured Maribacter sp. TaxID=431308 RepID=UPI002624D101|nr:glycosyltransferase N-terminal domain-containing protein [uncultured Maribacter sp.]